MGSERSYGFVHKRREHILQVNISRRLLQGAVVRCLFGSTVDKSKVSYKSVHSLNN